MNSVRTGMMMAWAIAWDMAGTLCENNDWFARDRPLPRSSAAGDLFVIHDTGAHGHSMGFNYNSALRAPEVLIRTSYHNRRHSSSSSSSSTSTSTSTSTSSSETPAASSSETPAASSVLRHVDCIRRRETFETLFGQTHVPADLMTADDRFGGTALHPDATL